MATGTISRAATVVRKSIVATLLFAGLVGQIGCTRDEVASAVSSLAVQLEATLVPWGATVVANAQELETSVPAVFATAKAPATTPTASPTLPPPTSTNTPLPSSTPTTIPTDTPSPTVTNTPLPTETPTETPTLTITPTATPFPNIIVVPGAWMILIGEGPFNMGASADLLASECTLFRDGCQTDWFSASEPIHTVRLNRFYMDSHEVTNEAFVSFLNDRAEEPVCLEENCYNPDQSRISGAAGSFSVSDEYASHPATGITWYGAAAYCDWREARLPTEAEWEKAAGWDNVSASAFRYPWGNTFNGANANFCDSACDAPQANMNYTDGFSETAPVASLSTGLSPFGIYDMAGNVWEWVSDWYDPLYYAQSPEENPPGPIVGESKVVRGGSWFDTGNFMATAIRFPSPPENADRTIGFRCADDLP